MTDQTRQTLTSWIAKLLFTDSIFKGSILIFNITLALFLQDTEVSQHALLISISLVFYVLCDFGGTTKILDLLNKLDKITIIQQIMILRLMNLVFLIIPSIISLTLLSLLNYLSISIIDITLILLYTFTLLLNFDALLIYYRQSEIIGIAGLIGGFTILLGLPITIHLENHISSFLTLILATFFYSISILYRVVNKDDVKRIVSWSDYSLILRENFKHAEAAFVNAFVHQSPIILLSAFGSPSLVSSYFLFQRINQIFTMPTSYFVQGMALKIGGNERDVENIILKVSITLFLIICTVILLLGVAPHYINVGLQDYFKLPRMYLFFALSIPLIIQQQYLIQSYIIDGRIRKYSLLTFLVCVILCVCYFSNRNNMNIQLVIGIWLGTGLLYTILLWLFKDNKSEA